VRDGKPAAVRLVALLLAAALLGLASACGGGGGNGDGNAGPTTDDPTSRGSVTPEVIGVITDIKYSASGERIESITLRTDEGETEVVQLDPAIDYGILNETFEEHRRGKNRLRVGVDRRGGKTYATLILNA
jgi:hypothetical protein